jgi:hypothetical protein
MRRIARSVRRALLAAGAAALACAACAHARSVTVKDLESGPTANGLAESLAGAGVAVSNVTYTGSERAAGEFTGGSESVGFESGVVLDTGKVQTNASDEPCAQGLEGPNTCYEATEGNAAGPSGSADSTAFLLAGDEQLSALSGFETSDAAVLEFEFIPQHPSVQFSYVFGSEEYSDFANTSFNDVFAFFVNGKNCALVPGTSEPVSVNTINNGSDAEGGDITPRHAQFFRDNVRPKPTIDTQMDGLTTILACDATVNVGVRNKMKLAIADASDEQLDSAVFLEAGSLISGTQITTTLSGGGKSGGSIAVPEGTAVSDTATLAGTNAREATGTVEYKIFSDAECASEVRAAGSVAVSAGVVPASPAQTLPAGTYYWQAHYSGDAKNNAATSTCGAEVETVEAASRPTSLTTTLSGEGKSGAKITVKEGHPVTDATTLAGENTATATGTVEYDVYSDAECKNLIAAAGTVTVSAGAVPPSEARTLTPAGEYFWRASYSGDARNKPSRSKCGTEVETVEAGVARRPTQLSTSLSGEGKSGTSITVKEGSSVTDTATLSGENAAKATGTVVFDVFSDRECAHLVTSGALDISPGAPITAQETLTPAGSYYWVVRYEGDAANEPSESPCRSEIETVEGVPKPTQLATTLSGEGATGASITVREGAAVKDFAAISGENAAVATGTIEYRVYADAECKHLVATAGSETLGGGARLGSEAKTLRPAGSYFWQASYSGDAANAASKSVCGSEVETVEAPSAPAPTQIVTALTGEGRTGGAITVSEGAIVSDSAMLSGANAARATGSVQYAVYSDAACTKLFATAGTVTVSAGSVPASQLKVLPPGRTYYWQASYGGDAANQPSESACGSEIETVERASSSQPPAPTPPPPPLAGEGEGAGGGVIASSSSRPSAPCRAVVGGGRWGARGAARGAVAFDLSTEPARRAELRTFAPRARLRASVGSLDSARCLALPGGFEFRGSGPASVNRKGGYEASFAVRAKDGSTFYTLTLTRGGRTVFRLRHRKLDQGGRARFS